MNIKNLIENYAAEAGVTLSFDDAGACTLPLEGDRALHLQLRDEGNELDILALLGTVPSAVRALVFTRLLSANLYWKETLGATLAWQDELQQVVLAYPLRADVTDEATVRNVFDRFIDLQDAWAARLAREIDAAASVSALEDTETDLAEQTVLSELDAAAGSADETRLEV